MVVMRHSGELRRGRPRPPPLLMSIAAGFAAGVHLGERLAGPNDAKIVRGCPVVLALQAHRSFQHQTHGRGHCRPRSSASL